MEYRITVRKYQSTDCAKISELFYRTVHSVNAKDYTSEQLFAWAKDEKQLLKKQLELLKQNTLIAEIDCITVGFGSITSSGCLDLLYVHKDFQGCGIATKLCNLLEQHFSVILTYASITAKPFFEKRGYTVIYEQEVERSGVKLKNYKMQKSI